MMLDGIQLKALYINRFSAAESGRDAIWQVLCSRFFERWIDPAATVLDLAAGHCEFINNVTAARRIAVDLNPDMCNRAAPGVETFVQSCDDLRDIPTASVDVVFVSNFFEHVTREVILGTLREIRRVLRPTGRLLVLQPNVRYCGRDYWMFFDHITPIDDRALAEALTATGLYVETSIPRFLPYTTRSRLPHRPGLVHLYLRLPIVWRVFGAQAFLVATPRVAD